MRIKEVAMWKMRNKLKLSQCAIIYMLFSIQIALSQQAEITSTIYPPVGSQMGDMIIKQDRVSDENGNLLRIENYFTEKYSKEHGYATQTDIYSGFGYPTQFIMTFTKEAQENIGFLRRIDLVDKADKLIGVRFDLTESEGFQAIEDEIKALEKFPLHSMGSFIRKYYEPVEKPNNYNYETPIFRGTTCAQYLNLIEDIGSEELTLIAGWCKMHGAAGMEKYYKRKIQVKEKDMKLWICFQEQLIQYLIHDTRIILQYYYLGSSFDGPSIIVTYMRNSS
jgi:hypothetical protein